MHNLKVSPHDLELIQIVLSIHIKSLEMLCSPDNQHFQAIWNLKHRVDDKRAGKPHIEYTFPKR